MTHVSITKLYELLSHKIGKESAENFTNFIEHKIKDEVDNKSQMLATKADLHQEVSRLERLIIDSKVDMLKWMFAFWATLVIMMFGLYLKK
jgi:hypothetical protein